jgi:uncharacterized coiled-coil DUF342 family protein
MSHDHTKPALPEPYRKATLTQRYAEPQPDLYTAEQVRAYAAALVAERDECNERRIETIAMCYQLRTERDAAVREAQTLRNQCVLLDEKLDAAVAALQMIAAIEDKMYGGDWDEINMAREIVRDALTARRPTAQDKP